MQTKSIAVRFTENDVNKMKSFVGAGFATSPTDYIRRAVREQMVRDSDTLVS